VQEGRKAFQVVKIFLSFFASMRTPRVMDLSLRYISRTIELRVEHVSNLTKNLISVGSVFLFVSVCYMAG